VVRCRRGRGEPLLLLLAAPRARPAVAPQPGALRRRMPAITIQHELAVRLGGRGGPRVRCSDLRTSRRGGAGWSGRGSKPHETRHGDPADGTGSTSRARRARAGSCSWRSCGASTRSTRRRAVRTVPPSLGALHRSRRVPRQEHQLSTVLLVPTSSSPDDDADGDDAKRRGARWSWGRQRRTGIRETRLRRPRGSPVERCDSLTTSHFALCAYGVGGVLDPTVPSGRGRHPTLPAGRGVRVVPTAASLAVSSPYLRESVRARGRCGHKTGNERCRRGRSPTRNSRRNQL
jgi:hypothetical protein